MHSCISTIRHICCSIPLPPSLPVKAPSVELQALALADVVAAARTPAEALARRYGVTFSVTGLTDDVRCLCDRTLAKQTVISCLGVLLSKRPRFLELLVTRDRRIPSLDLRLTPPLPSAEADALHQELGTCRSLMAAQGSSVRAQTNEAALCSGLNLLFRPERGPHVLVIDDNEKMLQLYERYLASGHLAISTATSAHEAQEHLQKALPDAIIIDVMMRDVDGWDLLQQLRSQPKLQAVPIVVCSVLNEPEMAYALGAQAYLKKPITADDLLATLSRLLDDSR